MRYSILTLAAAVLFPSMALGATRAQESRFSLWLDVLEKPLSSARKKSEAVEALLLEPSARIAAYNLEALGRIYGEKHRGFVKMHFWAKQLEDALGGVKKWKELGNPAKLQDAKAALGKVLNKGSWYADRNSPRIRIFRKFLNEFDWSTEQKDQEFIVARLVRHLEGIEQTPFDMHTLEQGNGLHELRRELRWFLVEANVVNGPVSVKPGRTCPIEAYNWLLEKTEDPNYGDLPENKDLQVSPCRISRCLYLGVNQMVIDLGGLKDEAERLASQSSSDTVPEELREKAEKTYATMVGNGLLPGLIQELKECAD